MGPFVKIFWIHILLCLCLLCHSSHADDLAGLFSNLALDNDPTLRQARAQYRVQPGTADTGSSGPVAVPLV